MSNPISPGVPPSANEGEAKIAKLQSDAWVSKNIMRHLHIKEQIGILRYLSLFLQKNQTSAQNEANAKWNLTHLAKKEVMEEFASRITAKNLLPLMKDQLHALKEQLQLQKQFLPASEKEIGKQMQDLEQIAKSLPNLSSGQETKLKEIWESMQQRAQMLPKEGKKEFWLNQMGMLENMLSESDEILQSLQSQKSTLEKNQRANRGVQEEMQSLVSLVSRGNFGETEANSLLAKLENLQNAHEGALEGDKQALGSFLKTLEASTGATGVSFPKGVAKLILREGLRKILAQNPGISKEKLKELLKKEINLDDFLESDHSFFQSIGKYVKGFINEQDFPTSAQNPLVVEKPEGLTLNQEVHPNSDIPLTEQGQSALLSAKDTASSTLDKNAVSYQENTKAYNKSIASQKKMTSSLMQSAQTTAAQSSSSLEPFQISLQKLSLTNTCQGKKLFYQNLRWCSPFVMMEQALQTKCSV